MKCPKCPKCPKASRYYKHQSAVRDNESRFFYKCPNCGHEYKEVVPIFDLGINWYHVNLKG